MIKAIQYQNKNNHKQARQIRIEVIDDRIRQLTKKKRKRTKYKYTELFISF